MYETQDFRVNVLKSLHESTKKKSSQGSLQDRFTNKFKYDNPQFLGFFQDSKKIHVYKEQVLHSRSTWPTTHRRQSGSSMQYLA